ncbi:thioredoxin domain-containing protein [Candidatus Uhrbacteria bacterium]|nr:thioredoxin domain-containing protein [Candidatus Uhrbacteria bacterium]
MDEENKDSMEGMSKKERRNAIKEEQKAAAKAESRSKIMRSASIWVGAFLILGLGTWGLIKMSGPQTEQPALSTTEVAIGEQVKGAENAAITLIEYSDFQCPACKQYAPVVKQVLENYPDDVRFVYRHYPLRQIHAQAQIAAEAAEAAGMQGRFFEFHDLVFDGQDSWIGSNSKAETIFVGYAEQLGLDLEKFKSDMKSAAVRDKVNNDYSSGTQSGITGTPSFFMNGQRIQNPRGFDPFRLLIDAELDRIAASAVVPDIQIEIAPDVDGENVVEAKDEDESITTEDGTDEE